MHPFIDEEKMELKTWMMIIAYDGKPFYGWQRQRNLPTVQGLLERALTQMNGGKRIEIQGASRTDAGVHAEAQVAVFKYQGRLQAKDWIRGLNALTHEAITIREVREVSSDFHPRHHSKGKHYRYLLWHGGQAPPWVKNRAWVHHRRLDLEAMAQGARALHGEWDFSAFRASGCDAKTTIRRIDTIKIHTLDSTWLHPSPGEGQMVAMDFWGNAFLKYMIRIMVGTLVEVGLGSRKAKEIFTILQSLDRRQAGKTAPPHGLTLAKVFYDQKIFFED